MDNKLRITELDFDTIKENLKNYFKTQTYFKDYDFDGSGLSILLDVLAYNTHYNSYYLNTVANESFMDTAIFRDSVVSHAKTLGYTPYSMKSAKAFVNITIPDKNNLGIGQISLPRGFSFRSEAVDNNSYNFCLLDEYKASLVNGHYYFENIPIYEGIFMRHILTYDSENNPKAIFEIPDRNVDIDTIEVYIRRGINNTETDKYKLSNTVLNVGADSKVFFIQENLGELYQIYFGNNIIGKGLNHGDIVILSYLSTSGAAANKVKNFVTISKLENFNTYNIQTIIPSYGGSSREDSDSIKLSAISKYTTQNRLVNINDYKFYIKQKYPIVESISVWGGEENVPKVFGKIFISIKPRDDYYLSETEKLNVVNDIVKPISIIGLKPEIIDPEFLYVLITTDVYYNQAKLSMTTNQLTQAVIDSIKKYNKDNLNNFESSLIISRLQDDIDGSDQSIVGNDVLLRVQKRFTPVLNKLYSYTVDFGVPIKKTSTSSKLYSSEFIVRDSNYIPRTCILEEIPDSETGVSSIVMVDSGVGYTTPPKVIIDGDGFGAKAVAKLTNGKIESVEIINRGINYSKATVSFIGGGGVGAVATAIVDSKIGELRIIYYDSNAKRIIVNDRVGIINYRTGLLNINNVNILNSLDPSGDIKIAVESDLGIIQTSRNILLHLDEKDPQSIQVFVHMKK